MTLLAGAAWSPTDDDGTGNTGTAINAAWVAAIKASIEDAIHSVANPTFDVKDIIDEIRDARVSGATDYASLDARLDAMDASIAGIATPASVLAGVGKTNLLLDETFLIWAGGDAVAPTCWTLTGAAGTVARAGTGLADTNTKIGDFCAKITRVAADTTLSQIILSAAYFPLAAPIFLDSDVGFGAWVRSTSIAGARLYISDGAGTTYSTANAAANTWEWLTVTRTIDAAADGLIVGVINDVNASSCYLSGGNLIVGDIGGAPSAWSPSPVVYEDLHFSVIGNLAVATPKFAWAPHRPGIVKQIYGIVAGLAPSGASVLIDVNTWDGAAYTSMLSGGRLTILAAGVTGSVEPSGTYARRCLRGNFTGATTFAGSRLSIDVDQIGSINPGADVTICVRVLFPARYLESVLGFDQVGI